MNALLFDLSSNMTHTSKEISGNKQGLSIVRNGKRIMKKELYICTTPFQIISSISMCMSFGNDADILIDPQSRNSDKYISNIRKLSVFKNVFNAKEIEILNKIRNPNKTKRKITITLSYIFLNSVIH